MASKAARDAAVKMDEHHLFRSTGMTFDEIASIIDDALREERHATEAMNGALFQCVEMLHYGRGYPDTVARGQAALAAYREARGEGAAP